MRKRRSFSDEFKKKGSGVRYIKFSNFIIKVILLLACSCCCQNAHKSWLNQDWNVLKASEPETD